MIGVDGYFLVFHESISRQEGRLEREDNLKSYQDISYHAFCFQVFNSALWMAGVSGLGSVVVAVVFRTFSTFPGIVLLFPSRLSFLPFLILPCGRDGRDHRGGRKCTRL